MGAAVAATGLGDVGRDTTREDGAVTARAGSEGAVKSEREENPQLTCENWVGRCFS